MSNLHSAAEGREHSPLSTLSVLRRLPMKKSQAKLALLLCVMLTALTVSACAQVSVRPAPSDLVRQMVAGRTFQARLAGYTWSGDAANLSLTFTLCEPETFSRDGIEALQKGDTVVAGGFPYEVFTVTNEEGLIVVNEGLEFTDALVFRLQDSGVYTAATETEIPFWRESIVIECPVSPDAVFLDWGDPEAEIPLTCTIDELMDRVIDDSILLNPDNTEITFDEEGRLSVLLYRYSPMN